jgi:16S rRNA (guanine966-N2)-methyltransferase
MIRISGGRFRGQNIHCPKGKAVRPTTAFVRESLFNILGPRLADTRLLDLFAGCGIVGVEALSRGVAFVQAVEMAPGHCRILEKNREHLKLSPETYKITCQDVFAWLKRLPQPLSEGQRFDIIFLDPPYAMANADAVVDACFAQQILAKDGLLIWESAQKNPVVPPHAEFVEARRYGSSTLSFFRYPTPPAP